MLCLVLPPADHSHLWQRRGGTKGFQRWKPQTVSVASENTVAQDSASYSTNSNRDPHFRDYLQFHEFFHGNDGRGLGASHQTGCEFCQ